MYAGFELTLSLGDPTCPPGLPVTVMPYQITQGLLVQFLLIVGPVGPQTYSVFPVLEWKYVTIIYNLF